MSFLETLAQWPDARIDALIAAARPRDVDAALASEARSEAHLAALLSPHARPQLEPMAREARRLTRWHFGRTIGLYAPIYLSNVCQSNCLYCGFAPCSGAKLKRTTLTPAAIHDECRALATHGFGHVLLLTGDAPHVATLDYLEEAVTIARGHFASVSVEIYAMDEAAYARLCRAGLEGVTLYQETYDRAVYQQVHQSGRKRDYAYRVDAPERAGRAGAWRLNLGVLLGLSDWRRDMFRLALHARYIQQRCWQSAVAVSFPRLHHVPETFQINHPVSDADLVQLMLALRLFLPEAGFVLSTRETAALRDRLIPLGVTLMSAGSSTRPGGYATCGPETLEQFAIEDTRPPAQVAAAIRIAGYDPVWKDFDPALTGAPKNRYNHA